MLEGFEYGGISRRRFLGFSLAAGGVIALKPRWSAAGEKAGNPEPEKSRSAGEPVRWAFLSDTHIAADPENNYRGSYPYRNLEKTLAQIAADLPEGLVVTGDIARLTGQVGDYENFKKLLIPAVGRRPIYLAPGNHDHRGNLLDVFERSAGQEQPVKGKHILTVDTGPVRLILLDSLVATNETAGLLGKAQRTWLQGYLQTSDNKPVILFFHHSLRDDDGDLLDSPRLFEIIKPFGKVKALVYGHSHEYAFSDQEGIHLINLPAVGYSFLAEQPLGWVEAQLSGAGGKFILHTVAGNTQMEGDTRQLRWRS